MEKLYLYLWLTTIRVQLCLIKMKIQKYNKVHIGGSQVCLQARFNFDMGHISFYESLVVWKYYN